MFLVTFHTIKRLFECWFITEYSTTARFSVLHYVWGLAFYTILVSGDVAKERLHHFDRLASAIVRWMRLRIFAFTRTTQSYQFLVVIRIPVKPPRDYTIVATLLV